MQIDSFWKAIVFLMIVLVISSGCVLAYIKISENNEKENAKQRMEQREKELSPKIFK